MKNKILKIACILILVILSLFYLNILNNRINYAKSEQHKHDEEVYYAIKYFMNDEFDKMNNGEITNENLEVLDVLIDYTNEYSPYDNLNEYFINMKYSFTETKEGYKNKNIILLDLKESMIKDGLNEEYINDWVVNVIE